MLRAVGTFVLVVVVLLLVAGGIGWIGPIELGLVLVIATCAAIVVRKRSQRTG